MKIGGTVVPQCSRNGASPWNTSHGKRGGPRLWEHLGKEEGRVTIYLFVCVCMYVCIGRVTI